MNLVLMGSGRFAIPVLDALVVSGHKLLAVVTQPDRPRGRGRQPSPTPVKEEADTRSLYLYQPEDVSEYEFMREMRALSPDLIVVSAYGQFLSKDILSLPKYGCVNVHASLLPRWRGPAPVARAILHGDKRTGVTVHKVVVKLDAGEIYAQREVDIAPEDTTPSLEEKLAPIGAQLVLEVIEQFLGGTIKGRRQDERKVSIARKFKKEEGRIRWKRPAAQVDCMIRAMQPFPGAHAFLGETRLVLLAARAERGSGGGEPGTVVSADAGGIRVRCSEGQLVITRLQPESRREMTAQEFLTGHAVNPGDTLR